jgi:hypothetical protein
MLQVQDVDLTTDPAAARYIKTEIVEVVFARQEGELGSLEGPNRYRPGDALITGCTGSRWCVALDRFGAKYAPVPPTETGQDGRYRARPIPVLAKRMDTPFTVARCTGGDVLQGTAGDWLLQYGAGDFGIADAGRFAEVYRKLE